MLFADPPPPFDYIPDFAADDPRAIVADWQAHVAAGRIGDVPPMSADVRAAILAAEAIVARRRRSVW